MTKEENLLVVASEECAEISAELMKALRFGVNGCHPDNPAITNGERILKEYTQLRAVMDMLMIKQIIPPLSKEEESEIYRNKISAVEYWEQYSEEIGRINYEDLKNGEKNK